MLNDTYTVTVDLATLKAVSEFSAVRDVRYYFNGVLFDFSPKGVNLVATDGRALIVANVPDYENRVTAQVIVPINIIKKLPKTGKAVFTVTCNYVAESAKGVKQGNDQYIFKFTLPDCSSVNDKAVDGKYPDYKRLFDSVDLQAPQEVSQISTKYMALLEKVRVTLGQPYINMFGEKPSYVVFEKRLDVCALIAHLKVKDDYMRDTTNGSLPEFVK